MSRKQEIYRDILRLALPMLRNAFTWNLWTYYRRRAYCRELSELIHNLPVSILDPEWTAHDDWFMANQAEAFCRSKYVDQDTDQFVRLICELKFLK
ncbi:hypothetical protein KSF73_02465 [Burkholderiaceae bacterium DAT-1]|nr:hypothetical protein [Burkholderiaceae bacterium DAT-1]